MDFQQRIHHATAPSSTVQDTPPTYKSPVPFWGTIIIAGSAILFLLALFTCCMICLCRRGSKRKPVRGVAVTDPFEKFAPTKHLVQPGMDDGPLAKKLGIIHYTLDYNLRDKKLYIGVVKIDNLPGSLFSKPSQPFVKVRLHPNPKSRETKHVNFSHNPMFNETFEFMMPPEKQDVSTIIFTVYDFQMFGKHKKLSQLVLPLQSLMLSSVIEECAELDEPKDIYEVAELGDVCVSLKYVPSQSKLTVVVIEAKNLMKLEPDYKDPYVKLYLCLDNKIIKKKKTAMIVSAGINPYYNESFDFSVTQDKIKPTSLLVKVAFKTGSNKSKNLGEACIGFSETDDISNEHWKNIVEHPGQPFARWHTLVLCDQ